jgi:hypothetical protein
MNRMDHKVCDRRRDTGPWRSDRAAIGAGAMPAPDAPMKPVKWRSLLALRC